MKTMEVITFYLNQLFAAKAIKAVLAFIWMSFSYLIWGVTPAIIACVLLVVMDFILWFTLACYRGEFRMTKLRQWLMKFILYWIALIVWHLLDVLIFHSDIEFWAQNFIVLYLGITEWISVIKHLWTAWLHLPIKFIERLEWVKSKIEDTDFK